MSAPLADHLPDTAPLAARQRGDDIPVDLDGRPLDRTLCPDCYRLFDPACKTCGGRKHNDQYPGRVCPRCGGGRYEATSVGGNRGGLAPCGACTVPRVNDHGYTERTRGLARYIYSREREYTAIAAWLRAHPDRGWPVKEYLQITVDTPEAAAYLRSTCPYPVDTRIAGQPEEAAPPTAPGLDPWDDDYSDVPF